MIYDILVPVFFISGTLYFMIEAADTVYYWFKDND